MAPISSPTAPRTFPGDPNPPPTTIEPTEAPKTSSASVSSAGTGSLPPSSAGVDETPSAPAAPSNKSYSVVERPDGSRDLFVSDETSDTRMGQVDVPDADKILHSVGRYDEASKTWDNIPEETAKSLVSGRLGFGESLMAHYKLGEAEVVQGLLGAKVMRGEMTGAAAKEQGEPGLVAARLKINPAMAWSGGFGSMIADMVKHPLATAKSLAEGVAEGAPLMADIALKGTLPGAAGGIVAGAGASAAALLTGPLAPATAAAAIMSGAGVGASYGTFQRTMDVMGGQFAMEMVRQGYDDETVQKYAPIVGAFQGALSAVQFELLTPSAQASVLKAVAGSPQIKAAIESKLAKYLGNTAMGAGAMTLQSEVNLFANNLAAAVEQRPENMVAGPEAAKQLFNSALQATVAAALIHAPGALMEGGAPKAAAPSEEIKAPVVEKPGKAPILAEPTVESAKNKFVVNRPFDLALKETDKATAEDLRAQFSGIKNEQIVRGTQLAQEVKQNIPSVEERQGMFWYKAAEGNRAVLEDALQEARQAQAFDAQEKGLNLSPEQEKLAKLAGVEKSNLGLYADQIQAALDLSPEALAELKRVDQYYNEAGAVSQDVGTIKTVRENYQNRIYAPEKQTDFVKTETQQGIKQTTRHAKQRVFDTEFDAARAGKVFATTDVADALSVHNEEMARVNTSRKMADAMADAGVGAWKREVPDGWEQVGTLQKNVPIKDKNGEAVIGEDGNQVVSRSLFVAPAGIAKGLEAISDPNFTKKIDSLRNLQRFQGLVKTVDLSFSFFHHLSMLAQTIYQRDVSTLLQLPKMEQVLKTPQFAALEQDFALHGGITATVEANMDILRNLTQKNDDLFSKIVNLPGVKQVLEQTDKNSTFLFGKMQRLMKVNNYAVEMANWVAKHPEASNAEVLTAKRAMARHVNTVYGGLNWEQMGMTKSNLSLLRLGLLAPDWTISNLTLLKQAIGEKGIGGNASRAHILSALVVGMVGTEALNKVLTGHFTDENKHGHELEIEISPDVYVSLLRGGIGDISKFASMIAESGLGGLARFTQAKLAPVARTGTGLLTNTQYTGQKIVKKNAGPVAGTYQVLKYLLQNLAPVPLGLSNLLGYAQSDEPTIHGAAAVGTGVGRFSTSGKNKK